MGHNGEKARNVFWVMESLQTKLRRLGILSQTIRLYELQNELRMLALRKVGLAAGYNPKWKLQVQMALNILQSPQTPGQPGSDHQGLFRVRVAVFFSPYLSICTGHASLKSSMASTCCFHGEDLSYCKRNETNTKERSHLRVLATSLQVGTGQIFSYLNHILTELQNQEN